MCMYNLIKEKPYFENILANAFFCLPSKFQKYFILQPFLQTILAAILTIKN